MTDDLGRAGTTVAELEAVLLEAKLSLPHRRAGSVSRAGLIETARGRDCRVVGVTAPPGYGKSTLMAEWAETEDRHVGWVSLDRLDDDPSALLFLLASAYAQISDHTDLIGDVGGLGVSALGRAAPRLGSAFQTSPVPFVLMLDDLQELRSPACHDVLSVVIRGYLQVLNWWRQAVRSSLICRGCGLRAMRWSWWPVIWLWMSVGPSRSSPRPI